MIMVMPTFYPKGNTDVSVENSARLVKLFPKEFTEFLMPAAESRYRTFALTADKKGFEESRTHRAFGGFSMGGVTTWYIFLECLNFVSTFIPESGDCWYYERLGGRTHADETAQLLCEAVKKFGFTAEDFRIYAATGSEDIAYPQLDAQINAMKNYGGTFNITDETGKENLTYIVGEGCTHWYGPVREYFFDIVKEAYRAE